MADDYDEDYEGDGQTYQDEISGIAPLGQKRSIKYKDRQGKEGTKEKTTYRFRACLVCRLILSDEQFYKHGCPNCPFLQLKGQRENLWSCTTQNFTGCLGLLKPEQSWAARFNALSKGVVGCYAVSAVGELPEAVKDKIAIHLDRSVGLQEEM